MAISSVGGATSPQSINVLRGPVETPSNIVSKSSALEQSGPTQPAQAVERVQVEAAQARLRNELNQQMYGPSGTAGAQSTGSLINAVA